MSKSITIAANYDSENLIKYFDSLICNKVITLDELIENMTRASSNTTDIDTNVIKSILYRDIKDNVDFGHDCYPYMFIGHNANSKHLYVTQYSNIQNVKFIYKYNILAVQEGGGDKVTLSLENFDIILYCE